MISLEQINLPDFGKPAALPAISAAEYGERLGRMMERMQKEKLDVVVIYADREHFGQPELPDRVRPAI